MLIYLYGADSYRRLKKLKEILKTYTERYALRDMLEIDLQEDAEGGWLRARDFLNQPSMFVESKVLVLREAGREEHSTWSGVLKSELNTEKTFVVISDSESPHKHFSFLLQNPSKAQEFKVLRGSDRERFLSDEASALGIKFTPDAWRYFLRMIASFDEKDNPEKSIWQGVMELKKIALGSANEITRVELERALHFSEHGNFYDLVKVLLSGRTTALRLTVLEELFSTNTDPARAFNTLCYFASGKDALFLAEADVSIKSGKLDYETALLKTALR